ncbi:putative membrane protein [Devosia subaequoris]|uniref:Putative membrane protein n=1 Tax=Devosia subaequoris TaxID=395930 RepID=A0A7W6NAK9_9HYPH|nr:DUF2061 domain-containing protein [Devosia subaequoris]MBB4051564.1 putative membrane protein [Devosia subaequoris]MCP1209156.1 DUF2061 domain-containing protein [Devosia subaequoris]
METPVRSVVKAITWQVLGLFTMTTLAWFATGDLVASGSLALSAAFTGLICFFFHERIWARIRWGRIGQ